MMNSELELVSSTRFDLQQDVNRRSVYSQKLNSFLLATYGRKQRIIVSSSHKHSALNTGNGFITKTLSLSVPHVKSTKKSITTKIGL
jgi:uncharacterized protein (DUF1697 family)